MNFGIFVLTLVALLTIIGMTSITLSFVFETERARYIPTQPTQRVKDSETNKELDNDIETIFSTDEEEDLIIND